MKHAPLRVLQFGEGNFLRGFVDWMYDRAQAAGVFDGRIDVVQPIAEGTADRLAAQDGRYFVVSQGLKDGKPVRSFRQIACLGNFIRSEDQWPDVLRCARDRNLRIVVSNTTEAGIVAVDEPMSVSPDAPRSFPGKIARLLFERFQTFDGSPDRGLIILPCELIENNATRLREIVLNIAESWRLPDRFTDWVNHCCRFCNTLVDRIVPGHPEDPTDEPMRSLCADDPMLVTCEPYHLWAIEGPKSLSNELAPARLAASKKNPEGLNIVFTSDLTPYRTRKVRLLNGGHTSSVLLGALAGLETVGELVADPQLGPMLRATMLEEIAPTLPESVEPVRFAESVLQRFANPFIAHRLLSISLNSVSKWRVRVLPTLKDSLAATGKLPPRLTLSLAALLAFYDTADDGGDEATVRAGRRLDGSEYPISDTADVLAALDRHRANHSTKDGTVDDAARILAILSDSQLWEEDLTRIEGLPAAVVAAYEMIKKKGVIAAVDQLS